jgi:hypothetical protein
MCRLDGARLPAARSFESPTKRQVELNYPAVKDAGMGLGRAGSLRGVTDEAVHVLHGEPCKNPRTQRAAASSGYGLSAVLREDGHSIDDVLPRPVRRQILDAIPDPTRDLSYHAGWRAEGEVIPELLALITHPDYWPRTIQLLDASPLTASSSHQRLGKR